MTKKLWNEGRDTPVSVFVQQFTAGADRESDARLARHDVLGSIAHVMMLGKVGLLDAADTVSLLGELRRIHARVLAGEFRIEDGVEDVHSQVELELTRRLGDAGRRVHTGRSRNDQVLLDIKLCLRDEIRALVDAMELLARELLSLGERHRDVLLPGYTHLQVAMPSSFGLWFGAYAECLAEDLTRVHAAYALVDRNPLGTAAGYGSSFPLDREMTTRLLCFRGMHVNAVAAQMSRGRTERAVADALAAPAQTLARFAMDVTLYMSQNFGFLRFPDEWVTGSSIMPHKKNPDVFELIRARCNRIQALPADIALCTANLPSGYHRDYQELKNLIFPAFDGLVACFTAARRMIADVRVNRAILDDKKYRSMFSVEAVDALVRKGMPFRDAYRQVAADIENGKSAPIPRLDHTHIGSIGNPGFERIGEILRNALDAFEFERLDGLKALLKSTEPE